MKGQSLEQRMKKYESATHTSLPENIPVIVRIDGRAFHTFTRSLQKPFDQSFIKMMNQVAQYLCSNELQNVRMAYLQSDEISFLLHKSPMSHAWFDNDIQKITSVATSAAASRATIFTGYNQVIAFDARAFVLPEKEVCNYFIWRQRDWERNSLQMLARKHYSQKDLNNKSKEDIHQMLYEKGQNWNKLPTHLKRGRCIVPITRKVTVTSEETKGNFEGEVDRTEWTVDDEIPVFSKDREYINKFLEV